MIAKEAEKEKAIIFRKKGLSYNEILKKVPVAKSTLSLWLREVGLAEHHKQRLTEKRRMAQRKGALKRRTQRLEITKKIIEEAEKEIGKIDKKTLLLLGAALYWAEGSKEKIKSSSTIIGNSDPKLVKLVLKWLNECCDVDKERIVFSIYLHETAKDKIEEVKEYWSLVTGFSIEKFQRVVWKKNKISPRRKNNGKNYFGLLRITVKKSISLNRKIQGWISGIVKNSL